jgi:hypothetical protein
LEATLHQLLEAVQQSVRHAASQMDGIDSNAQPGLRAITPLAEGADRLFAEQALLLGYELCCVMPFPQAEFEQDFAPERALEPDSLTRFRRLLARAEKETVLTRLELGGSRSDEASAYGACGHTVLKQSDLLVAVWDGEWRGKLGGTEETLAAALHQGVPTIWVDAQQPHRRMLLESREALPLAESAQERTVPEAGDYRSDLTRAVERSLALTWQRWKE